MFNYPEISMIIARDRQHELTVDVQEPAWTGAVVVRDRDRRRCAGAWDHVHESLRHVMERLRGAGGPCERGRCQGECQDQHCE